MPSHLYTVLSVWNFILSLVTISKVSLLFLYYTNNTMVTSKELGSMDIFLLWYLHLRHHFSWIHYLILPLLHVYPIGNLSAHGKWSPAATRKSQWGARSGTQDPRPRIGFPMGNQACVVPRLLWDLLLLKLPGPELRQQVFTAYLWSNFLKSELNLPSMECNQFNHFSLYICKYPSSLK